MLLVVGMAGMAALTSYGHAAGASIAGDVAGAGSMATNASARAMVVSGQAGIVSSGAAAAHTGGEVADAASFVTRTQARIATNAFPTGRSLLGFLPKVYVNSPYEQYLGTGFIDALKRLSTGDHWFDMGSGDGVAIEEFFRTFHGNASGKAPKVTGLAFAQGDTDHLARAFPSFRGLYGRYLEDVPRAELGRANIISDVYGPLSYSPQFDRVLQIYADALEVGGEIHAFVSPHGAQLSMPNPVANVTDHDKARLFLRQLNDRLVGLKAEAPHEPDPKRMFGSPFRLKFTKTAETASVPKLHLDFLHDGAPPYRDYTFVTP